MALQNQEGTFVQAISNRWDYAMPGNMEVVTPSATAFDESILYIDDADVLTVETVGGQTVSVSLPAGFVPVRVVKVTGQTGTANIFRLY